MIPFKIENTFIELQIDFSGKITHVNAGNFIRNDFSENDSIYNTCPFLEGTIDALTIDVVFSIERMLILSKLEEYNVEVSLLKSNNSILVLIENQTNIYQYLSQLNQNRNDLALVREKIAKQNLELERLRKIADKANEEKSRFLAVMSHEVRNPLNSILAYADIILSETNNIDIKKYANSLKNSGKNLHVIVNDILDISKIEAGKLELIQEPISIKDFVENTAKDFRIQYQENNIELKTNLTDKLPDFVIGDSVRINQILSNLIKNSYKFTKNGTISINIDIISEKEKTIILRFNIEDTGRGMTQDELSSIFNEYHQTEVTDFTISKGAGLGLSIVKSLVERMQGKVSVKSEVGIGAVFSFEIPFEKTEKLKDVVDTELPEDLSGLKILFVDDDVVNQTIGKHVLEKVNANIVIARDGLEALTALKNIFFDIVLLDINMPNLTGEQLLLKRNEFSEENKKIPLIAVTANAAEKDIERYIKIGFADVISKPYNPKSLISTLQKKLK